jgi:thymine-DNA glycosylase
LTARSYSVIRYQGRSKEGGKIEKRIMAEEEVEEGIADIVATPSFEGRLKLSQFMYTNPETKSTSDVRRSPRLKTSLSAISSPSHSLVEGASRSPARAGKRKHDPEDTSNSTSGIMASRSKATMTKTTLTADGGGSRTPSPKKRSRTSNGYAPPSTYAHLPELPDVVAPNLLILFVGLNPGLQTARTGHAYAHPSNLFWKCK